MQDGGYIFHHAGFACIAIVQKGVINSEKWEAFEHNVTLIAAAPDLYEALEEARQELYECGDERVIAPLMERIEAALNKANPGRKS